MFVVQLVIGLEVVLIRAEHDRQKFGELRELLGDVQVFGEEVGAVLKNLVGDFQHDIAPELESIIT